jgi:hypothetical protein
MKEPVFAGFTATEMSLGGEVLLDGDPVEISDCTLGFIQVQFIETFWSYYRGKTNSGGSLLVQQGLPPARSQQTCRDCKDPYQSRFWYAESADLGRARDITSTPVKIDTNMTDEPFAAVMLGQVNSLTNQTNLLHETQIERHFCAILTLQDTDGAFRHLASRYWNLRWQATFQPSDFDNPFSAPWRVTPIKAGTGAAVGHTILGKPTDPRFVNIMTADSAPMCNDLIKQAANSVDNFLKDGSANPDFNPETRRESPIWTNFNVRH